MRAALLVLLAAACLTCVAHASAQAAPLARQVSVNPVPDVTGLSPAEAMVGDLDFGITVIGAGFVQGSTVLWNGEARDTGYISDSMLTATVRSADVAKAGTAFVSVSNPAPGGGHSPTARVFTISNPVPVVEAIEPASVWSGAGAFSLTVSGSQFTAASVVQVAGIDLTTTFVSSQKLETLVPASAVVHAGDVSVRVFTPLPGGGLSSAVFLEVHDDAAPPVTSVVGLSGEGFRTTVAFTLVATDTGGGVETTFWWVDEVKPGDYNTGTSVRVPAPSDHSNDGVHLVHFFSIDRMLNWEAPPKEVKVAIDTRPPTTTVAGASVTRGGPLAPRYYVYDALSPKARDALLQVIDRKGRVVQRCVLGRPTTRAWHTLSGCVAEVPAGTYKMRVLAHDLAGNAQVSTKSGVLTVR